MTLPLAATLASFFFLAPYFVAFIYLPAHTLTRHLKLSTIDRLSLNLVLGLSLYSLLVYLVRFLGLPFFIAEITLLIPTVINFHNLTLPQLPRFSLTLVLLTFTIIFTALIQSAVLIRSALPTPDGLNFINLSFHDSMQHLAIIKRLYQSFDIANFGFSGPVLNNYHHLIDLALAALTRFSAVSLYDTYYRLYPLTISAIFCLSLFTFTRNLTKNTPLSTLAILFTVFSGNASYFVHFVRGSDFHWGSNTFLINPLVDLLQNPASIFVLAQTLTVLLLLKRYPKLKYNHQLLVLLNIAIIAGTMIGFKAWGGLLILAALFLASLFHALKTRDFKPAVSWFGVVGLSLFLLLPHFDPATSASPVWAPGWSLQRMVNDPDRWNDLNEILKEQHYLSVNSWHYLAFTYAKWFVIYLLGNYWLRLIGLFYLLTTLRHWHRFQLFDSALLGLTLASFALPLFFNQGRMAYDIEQFSPYALMLAGIYTLYIFFRFLKHSLPQAKPPAVFLLVIIFILISAPSNATSIIARTSADTTTITNSELASYNQIASASTADAVVLLYPGERTNATLEFANFTGRTTYYSGRTLSVITGQDWETRRQQAFNFFKNTDPAAQSIFLTDNHLDYIFLYRQDLNHVSLPTSPLARLIFETEAGLFYAVSKP